MWKRSMPFSMYLLIFINFTIRYNVQWKITVVECVRETLQNNNNEKKKGKLKRKLWENWLELRVSIKNCMCTTGKIETWETREKIVNKKAKIENWIETPCSYKYIHYMKYKITKGEKKIIRFFLERENRRQIEQKSW